MNIIVDKKLFDKTITIGSKTMCAQEFLIDYSDELVSYYHGEDNGIMFFYKVAQNGIAVVIAIDVIINKLYDAECRIIVDMTNKALDYLYKE